MSIHRVNCGVANMHEIPDATTPLVSQTSYAELVKILEVKGEWNKIATPDGYQGWVEAKHLEERPSYRSDVQISSLRAYIYPGPDTCHRPLLTLGYGAPLQVSEDTEGRWISVTLISGQTGYIQRGDVLGQTALNVKDLALRFLEKIPFYWGGTTTLDGMDCSGFVQFLHKNVGHLLPRDSKDQYASLSDTPDICEPGDLLFFGLPGKDQVTHVAMYVGPNQIIHSTVWDNESAPGVKLSALDKFCCSRDLKGTRHVPFMAVDENFQKHS